MNIFRPAGGPLSLSASGGETRDGTPTRLLRMRYKSCNCLNTEEYFMFGLPFQHRAYIAKMQPIWDAEKAAAAAKANRENMIYLAKATGTPIPADF